MLEVSCDGRSRGGAFFRARRLAMMRMMITTTSGAPNKSNSSRMPAAPWDSGAKIGEDNMVSKVYQPCTDGSNDIVPGGTAHVAGAHTIICWPEC